MYRNTRLTLGILVLSVMLMSVYAQAAQSDNTDAVREVKSVPILIPAPAPAAVIPPNTDTVTTPRPSQEEKAMVTPVPAVTPSPIPEVVKKPITLEQALETAFRNNPDIRVALDNVQRSRGVVKEARARFNPSFNIQASSFLQGPTSSFASPSGGAPIKLVPSSTTNAGLNVLLPLDVSRRLSYASDITNYSFQVEYLSMVSVSEEVILRVKIAFYDLLRACGQRDVAQAAVDVASTRLQNTRSRREAGTVAQFDVTSAETDLANLNQQLIAAQNRVSVAQSVLNRVMGIDINNPTQVIGEVPPITITSVDIPQTVETAYTRRPEVKAAQTAITLNKTNIKFQRTELLPSLSLTGGTNYNFNPSGFSSDNLNWQAGFAITIPVWDGGVTRAKVDQARADTAASIDTLDQVKLGVAQDVRIAALNLQEAALRTQTTAQGVALAQEALRLANVRYESGIAVVVEVTNAESQLTQAKFNLVNAQYDYIIALAQLQRAASTQPELDNLQLLTDPATKAP